MKVMIYGVIAMSSEEDILYNETQDFGRAQFVRELAKLQQENKQLKSIIKTLIEEYNLEPTEYVENLLKGDNNE